MNKNLQIIARTTLKVLEKKPWNSLSLDEIKKKSKINQFDKKIKNKKNLLKNISSYFDFCLSKDIKNIEKSSPRDMIFEIVMLRFDILQTHRKGVESLFDSLKKTPHELALLLPNLLDSMILMLKYTETSNNSIARTLKVKGVLVIYILTFMVWLKDESDSLDKTMQALDDYLGKVDQILNFI